MEIKNMAKPENDKKTLGISIFTDSSLSVSVMVKANIMVTIVSIGDPIMAIRQEMESAKKPTTNGPKVTASDAIAP